MKIGIVGVGMVGEVVNYGMRRIGHDTVLVDSKISGSMLEDVLETDLVFVCVPTPSNKDGSCNISIVENVVHNLDLLKYKGVIAVKSTVTPGTTRRLDAECKNAIVAFCPEFLKEKSRFVDFIENHDVCLIGVGTGDQRDELYADAYMKIKDAHGSLPKQFVWLTWTEAEMAKYFSNCYNALRIVFANQFYDVCEKAGCDYTNIKNAIVKRVNINDSYLECNKNFRAFGGNCLPKDVKAFAKFAESVGAYELLWRDITTLNEFVEEEDSNALATA